MLLALLEVRDEPRLREAADAALGDERGRWPVPKPVWMPHEAAAARFLESPDLNERALAILGLVELRSDAARQTLAAHEANEPDPELRLLARSALAALGDEQHLPQLERELAARLDARDPDRPWLYFGEGLYGEPRPTSEPFRLCLVDLERHLLLAGSRETFERLAAEKGSEDLYVIAEHLTGLVGGGPLPASFHPFVPNQAGPAKVLSTPGAFHDWWQANAWRLEWDAAARRFSVRLALAAEE